MRRVISMLATLICSIVVTNLASQAGAQTTSQIAHGNCTACVNACQSTLDYCAKKKGKYADDVLKNSLKDCLSTCKMSGDLMARGSALGKKSAALCVEACNNCAKTCESFKDDNNMKACADECRKCAGNCQKVAEGAP